MTQGRTGSDQADAAPSLPAEPVAAPPDQPPEPPDPAPQDGLFDLPSGARRPRARVVLVTGPSGSGKTALTRRLGLPTVSLDDFYFDGDHPDLPRRYGIVDWDSPRSWDRAGAMAALVALSTTGEADLPVYDIPTNRRTGTTHLSLDGFPIFVAEGIFAAEIVQACREEDILADALCICRPRAQSFFLRLARDLGEARKPPLTLLRRGLNLYRNEPAMVADLTAKGTRKVGVEEAERGIMELLLRSR
ncbi:ATP-binding protein [Georgenia sp. TF02-10]|uniref:uridine kinase family protein n=1 Tax=Georgenia sp. TF02-10 TaxID=2917725 RepID=UPI001FA76DD6|nr:ATP-binding protein [Georgenia sp. TF02-10]UNX54478.1 ATP-binding protein [Georgenia sp. TF02-10]